MEKKTGQKQGVEQRAFSMVKALLCAYIVTGILLLLLTLLLYKAGLSEENINPVGRMELMPQVARKNRISVA